jgi:hypothetical protein
LTRDPAAIAPADFEPLRAAGLGDDAIQVIAYFAYVNRVADGVGVDPEPEWKAEE